MIRPSRPSPIPWSLTRVHINDVMTTEDGKYGVLTRERDHRCARTGSWCSLSRIPHIPRPIADFTETVTGGVHSTFIYKGYVYLTDDATGSSAGDRHSRSLQAEAGRALGN